MFTKVWSRTGTVAAAVLMLAACREPGTPLESPVDQGVLGFERNAAAFDLDFTPLPASAACVAGGTIEQILLPDGFVATLLAAEPDFGDLPDMNTVNESGPQPGRFLYRAHEVGSNGSVTVTDLETGLTTLVAQRADWERLDGIAWTPWGTILTAEEVVVAAIDDPEAPDALGGFVYEIDPASGSARVLQAVGSRSHEGIRFDGRGNLYGISERSPGYIFRFVPQHRRDLSAGTLYALRIVEDLGDRTGWAEWVPLDGDLARVDSDSAAALAGATGYARPEDVETAASTGDDRRGGRMLYVAVTSEHRVLAIDLRAGTGPRAGQVFVSDYVRQNVNAPADFSSPDNLALDRDGNLFITEDPGGTAPNKTLGDDVWVSRLDPGNPAQGRAAGRFLTITDCDSEPSGIYFSRSGRSLFVNLMHRGGDGADGAYVIQKISDVDFRIAGR
jgi:sugar lactone lactonase YvrE